MLQTFLEAVLPAEGPLCLCLLPEGKHLWAGNTDELARLAQQHADRTGVYFGTAAFLSTDNRKQSNVRALRALRLDVDAGEAKHQKDPAGTYPSQKEALSAAMSFFKASALLPSFIVSSGEGLHLYFCLDDPLAPDAWKPLAKGLSALCARHGLKADPSVTEDTARVLRPIGALHNNGKRVAVLKATGLVYTAADLRTRLKVVPPTRAFDLSINDELTLGYEGPPSSALKITQHCPALHEVASRRGDVQEPFWRAMLGLVKRCTEGRDLAHEWSSGYEGYDPDETDAKFDAWATGPTTCAEFAKHTDACLSCEYRGRVKSPINLGLMTPVEVERLPEEVKPAPAAPAAPTGKPWDGCIPPRFEVEESGGEYSLVAEVSTERTSDVGELVTGKMRVQFCDQIWWFGTWAEAAHSDDMAQVVLHKWVGGDNVLRYAMDQSLLASQSDLAKYLGSKAIHTTPHKKAAQAMSEYAKAQLARIRAIGKRPKVHDHLGLRILDSGELVVAHGKRVIRANGTIEEGLLVKELENAAKTYTIPLPVSATGVWGPEVWDTHVIPKARRHVEFLRRYYPDGMDKFRLAIMLGLSSPLMAFTTGEFNAGSTLPKMTSLSVALYSAETARGKTSACQAVALAFGSVTEQVQDSGKMGATDLGRLGRLSTIGTMPAFMDEMGGATAASVAQMISAVANGAGRVTMGKDRSSRQEPPWSLINLITTNTSQRDMVMAAQSNSTAIQSRLLEINVADTPQYPQVLRDSYASDWAALSECTGALGAVIHREIARLGVRGAIDLVTKCVAKAGELVKADQSERFQYRGLGAMLALHVLLRRLDLAPWDLAPLVATFKQAHEAGRDYVVANVLPPDSLERLARMLMDLGPQTVVTEHETRVGPRGTKFDVPLNTRFPDKIVARHIVSSKRTYIDTDAFKAWCRERGVNEQELVGAGKKNGVFVITEGRNAGKTWNSAITYFNLTKGLKENQFLRCRVYTIDVRKLAGYTGRDLSLEDETENENEAEDTAEA